VQKEGRLISLTGGMVASDVTMRLAMSSAEEGIPPANVVFGRSATMRAVREKLESVARVNVPVLILGESGTGKEVIAKLIHRQSPWRDGPFVKVTCPAIPGTLLESELFGYEKGAFTGANSPKQGRVEGAEQGTLFLDEIAELEYGLQSKLLQLLQDGTFSRIGGQQEKHVEARLVSATNRHLESEIQSGHFRSDLLHRINGISVRIPALRDRLEDIPELVAYLVQVYSRKFKVAARALSASFLRRLQQYHWPGNIRELENLVRRYVILGEEQEALAELPGAIAINPPMSLMIPTGERIQLKAVTEQAVKQIEGQIIRTMLARNHGSRRATAEALGISYRGLLYKLRELDLLSSRRLPFTSE
jgi:two-component system response regulator AtoC